MKEKYSRVYLKKLYRELGSIRKVAEKLDVPMSTMVYHFRKQRVNLRKGRGFPIPKKELIKLHEECGSITKVAAYLSKPYSTVRYWYHCHDIKVNPSGMTVFHEIRNTPFGSTQKSVLLGSLLGDGGVWLAPHSKNARLYVSHCEKQKQYLMWVHDLLQPFSRPIKQCEKAGKKMICGREVNASNFYRFWTIAHPEITEFYKRYYRNGKKGIDKLVVDELDLLSMSIWFADDGSIHNRDVNNNPTACSIATCSFTYNEHLVLIDAVKKYVTEFLDNIKNVLPSCIHYKL